LKPVPRFSERVTIKIPPPLLANPKIVARRPNWDILTSISFVILLIIAILLYCYVNHPFRHTQHAKIIYNSQPIFITSPIKSTEVPSFVPKEQNVELIINSNKIEPHYIRNVKMNNSAKDYGI